mgnify:CR=1 FL=1
MDIDYEKIKRELEARDKELAEATEGYCMIEQPKIDREIAYSALFDFIDECAPFLIKYASHLTKTQIWPEIDASSIINRAIDLLGVIARTETTECIEHDAFLIEAVCYVIQRKDKSGNSPVLHASFIADSLKSLKHHANNYGGLTQDYDDIITENNEYRQLLKGAI